MSAIPQQGPSRRRASGIGWFLDWIGDVQVVHMNGRVTDESFDGYLDALAQDIDARRDGETVSILYHVPEPSALSSRRRTRIAALLKSREDVVGRCTRAYAMATPSVVVRGGLKMVFWLAPPRYPTAVVTTAREAFEFIARKHAGVDPEAWHREFERMLEASRSRNP
jgi:hypothetical protein